MPQSTLQNHTEIEQIQIQSSAKSQREGKKNKGNEKKKKEVIKAMWGESRMEGCWLVSSEQTFPRRSHFQIKTPLELVSLPKRERRKKKTSSSAPSDLVVFLSFLFLFPKTGSLNPLIGCDRMGLNVSGQLNPVAECCLVPFCSRKEAQIYS